MKKILALIFAILMIFQCHPMTVAAAEQTAGGTTWRGDEVSFKVTAGEGAYKYLSYFEGAPYHNYEMSNHLVCSESDPNNTREIPQLFILLDASEDYTWTPNGMYSPSSSNYMVLYCCDIDNGYNHGIRYRRLNLEDSNYYSDESAKHIRGILTNSYPYVSMSQMKRNLAAAGFEYAEELDRAEIISAVQTAVWSYANGATDYIYCRTYDVANTPGYGVPLHDYTNEFDPIWFNRGNGTITYPSKSAEAAAAGERINALVQFLRGMEPRDLEEDRIIISNLQIVETVPVFENQDVFTTVVRIELNSSGSGNKDDVQIDLFVDDEQVATQKVELGKNTYDIVVDLEPGQTVKAVVSGMQYLPTDVYFYEAEGGREVSQSLVGVSGGMTGVYSEAETKLEVETTNVTADVYLRKVNREGAALPGAAFDLYVEGADDMLMVGTKNVDESGELIIEDLLPGTYELRETTAPTGYLKPEETIVFTIDENGSVSLASSNIATFKDGVIVVENEPDKTSVKANKVWKDEDNAYGVRPDSVKVKLLADGVDTGKTAILSEENGWSASFDDLPVKVNDKRVSYTIVEDEVASYISAVTGNMANGFTVTNTYNFTKISIDVNKVWDDDDNENGIRPESVTVKLLADGVDTGKTAVLSEENGWSASFEKLDFTKDGVKINYTVEEVSVEGYVPFITGNEIEGFVVTNVPENELTEINVYKSWIDLFNYDGLRPDSITVKLLADGVFTGETIVLSERNGWSGKFTNLYKYKDGNSIEYTVEEIDVPGYTSTIVGTASTGFFITNVRENDRTGIDVKKIWNDNDDADNIRPDTITVKLLANGVDTGRKLVLREKNNWSGSFSYLETSKDGVAIEYTIEEIFVPGYTTKITGSASQGFVITNTHEVETTSIDVTKIWDDNNDEDGIRPERITVKLYANGIYTGKSAVLSEENGWSESFTYLKVNLYGTKIEYSIQEVEVNGYISEISGDAEHGFIITNTRAIGKTDIRVKKVWDDENNSDGMRPQSVTVKLLADGEDTGVTVVLSARNAWSAKFRNLDIEKDGEKINYTVEEAEVEGYVAVVTNNSEYSFVITNTRDGEEPHDDGEKIDVAGEKIWNDGDNADGMRPESITVNLLRDGEVIDSVEITEEDGWKYSFTELPKYEGDREIVYTISEIEVEGYTTVIDGFNVINTRESEEETEIVAIAIPVTKIWDDGDDIDGARPESITVYLYADGELVDSMIITEADGWAAVFNDLEKYNEDGSEIVYTLSEGEVDDYTSEIAGSALEGFVITNEYVTELLDEDVPLAPQTGDDAFTMICLMIVSSVIICSVAVYRRKRI